MYQKMLFQNINLKKGLIRALDELGYTQPTLVQEKVIPLALDGKNIVGQSQTGTGKTLAFLLPLLNSIDTNAKELQAIILAPTRELAVQIYDDVYSLTKYFRVPATCIYGGASPVNQVVALNKIPRIIVATPGRLLEFIKNGTVKLSSVHTFVIDEVDRMLDMGFVRDIRQIRDGCNNVKQTFSFSATLNDSVQSILNDYMLEYEVIKIGDEVTVDKIDHSYVRVESRDKFINLVKLVTNHQKDKIIIFTNTKNNTSGIGYTLVKEGFKVGVLNGDIQQSKRLTILNSFIEGSINILVTTDVAARGLNMDNVDFVINYDAPREIENYIHRIGRTGRAGLKGEAIMFVSKDELVRLEKIESTYDIKVKKSKYKAIHDNQGKYGYLLLDDMKNQGFGFKKKDRKLKLNQGKYGNRKIDNKRKRKGR